jgi:hypothetical protein
MSRINVSTPGRGIPLDNLLPYHLSLNQVAPLPAALHVGEPGSLPESSEGSDMSTETEAVTAAVEKLTNAMSRLVKAIDDVGGDDAASGHIPEDLPGALDRLSARISAAKGSAA